MTDAADKCGACGDTRANHGHHLTSECQEFRAGISSSATEPTAGARAELRAACDRYAGVFVERRTLLAVLDALDAKERELEKLEAHLNPFSSHGREVKWPTEQPAKFISGVRYYLGMLEDDGDWPHEFGHIEELCKEFHAAIKARREASK